MSLAATLSASGMRPASFLPAIKCSNCGDEIEIARMGDHLCSQGPPSPPQHRHASPTPLPASNPYTLPTYSSPAQQYQAPPSPLSSAAPLWPTKATATTFAASPLQHAHSPSETIIQPPTLLPRNTSSSKLLTRAPMPPRINPDAANKPFLGPQYPRSASPASPASSRSGSRPPLLRGLTMQSSFSRDRSPSPELASNLDCAFPSFPTSTASASRPGTSNGRRTPVERAPSRGVEREAAVPPLSPRSNGTQALMNRANTIKSGPFNTTRRTDSQEEQDLSLGLPTALAIAKPADTQRSPERHNADRMPPRKASLPKDNPFMLSGFEEPLEHFPAVPTNAYDMHSRADALLPPPPPPPVEKVREGGTPLRARRPSLSRDFSLVSPQTDVFERPSSRNGRSDPRLQDAPPVPRPVQQYRQVKHAPSDSSSSVSSTTQSLSQANTSEGPSPISSATSSIDAFPTLTQATYEREERPKSIGRLAGYSTKSQQQNPGLRAEQPVKRSPPPNFARLRPRGLSMAQEPLQPAIETTAPPLQRVPTQEETIWPTRSASRGIRRTEAPAPLPEHELPPTLTIPQSVDEYDPYKPLSPNPDSHARSKSVTSEYSVYQPDNEPSTITAPPVPAMPIRPLQRRNTTARQHICRGCHNVIEGKSVKAADGRLTGRWHKQCFTCKTCAQPFSTADFYVIDDQPFCKQHYHEKNGSLCYGCKRGIEGQYLETGSGCKGGPDRKFHPHCFTCADCHLILSNDYFEIGGRAFCERHALSAMRGQSRSRVALGPGPGPGNGRLGPGGLQPPGRRELMAERRTTKLMMM